MLVQVDVLPSPAADPDGEGRAKGARALEPRVPSISITGFSGASPRNPRHFDGMEGRRNSVLSMSACLIYTEGDIYSSRMYKIPRGIVKGVEDTCRH